MAIRNNPVIAYVKCKDCGERASVHMVMRGKARKGDLYTRHCSCGTNQAVTDQKYIIDNAEPVKEWRDLVHPDFPVFDRNSDTTNARICSMETDQDEPATDQESTQAHDQDEPAADQESTQATDQDEPAPAPVAMIGIAALVIGGIAAIMGVKR